MKKGLICKICGNKQVDCICINNTVLIEKARSNNLDISMFAQIGGGDELGNCIILQGGYTICKNGKESFGELKKYVDSINKAFLEVSKGE